MLISKERFFTKDSFLSFFIIVASLIVINHLVPPSVDKVILLKLVKNKTSIFELEQARDVVEEKTLFIDVIDLNHKDRFSHPVLGVLGWVDNFFADIETPFVISKAGSYRFEVGSDDGFDLVVDGTSLCSFKGSRPFKTKSCRVALSLGEHNLRLSYYQGSGNAGLSLKVSDGPKGNMIFWGADSDSVQYRILR